MKKICFFFFSLIHVSATLIAKENKYKVSDIPPSLFKHAKAIIRNNETVFEIFSASHAIKKVQYAITIVNINGIDQSVFREYYNSFSRIKRIDASIYDDKGELIRKINNSSIQDYSAVNGFSLYEDSRIKYFDPQYKVFPFTIEYSFEVEYSGLLNYPNYYLYEDYNISTQRAIFSVIAPHKSMIRYYEKNIDSSLQISNTQDHVKYSWQFSNREALSEEPFSTSVDSYTPVVYIAPTDFELNGIKGNSESWKNIGLWSFNLNNGKDILDVETQNKIKNLVKNATNDMERIKILYEYLQNKTRYVSTQIGIGGWQPIDAQTVDGVSYGDCKALTNYMQAMLNVVGIKSHYTLVLAGRDAPNIIPSFPSPRFNHAFLCVPEKNDTLWLECTSQHQPFAAMGTFTDDRDVLIVTRDGGKLVHTKSYTQNENNQVRNIIINIDSTGNGQVDAKTVYKGKFYDDFSYILRMDDKDKKKQVIDHLYIPNFQLINFKYIEDKSKLPSITEELDLEVNNYVTTLGDKMLLNLNIMTKIIPLPQQTSKRISPIFIRRACTQVDTIIYKLPKGYTFNSKLEPKLIRSAFGEYEAKLISSETEIKYIRLFKMNKGTYPVSSYGDFVTFIDAVSQADESRIVLKRK
ncbi:MAG TPA: DUF3857 domain-containing protein [Bacteroidia bacterium]|nr:DUF3857 domain-containing protein [Bacteroidia bacterium]